MASSFFAPEQKQVVIATSQLVNTNFLAHSNVTLSYFVPRELHNIIHICTTMRKNVNTTFVLVYCKLVLKELIDSAQGNVLLGGVTFLGQDNDLYKLINRV